jgi:UTP--glucose-1-phosphate uridylyltransferase
MIKPVTRAVFPVAGLGTRFLPATKAMPKEMLNVVSKPLIQYAVEEAADAGITQMIFVTGRHKRAIEDHFDRVPELENELAAKGKTDLLELLDGTSPKGVSFVFTRQAKALGLGHAVLCAAPIVGNEPFAVLLADDLLDAQPGCVAQLLASRQARGGGSVIAVEQVAREHTRRYGIVDVAHEPAVGQSAVLRGIVEKPSPLNAPSTLGVIGRYVLEPEIFGILAKTGQGSGGEIQLTDGIAQLVKDGSVSAHYFAGQRFDCGEPQGFIQAVLHFARKAGYSITS